MNFHVESLNGKIIMRFQFSGVTSTDKCIHLNNYWI